MERVVVDENVYVFALKAEGTRDPEHLTCAELILCVQTRHVWAVTADIDIAYRRQFQKQDYYRGALASTLLRSLDRALHDSNRSIWLSAVDPVDGGYDPNDHHVVAAAAAVEEAILITDDVRLKTQLIDGGVAAARGFTVLSSTQATQELCVLNEYPNG